MSHESEKLPDFRLQISWIERKRQVQMANEQEESLWITEEGTGLAPLGRSKLTEAPCKFVGTEKRDNLNVFLTRSPRKPKLSETKRALWQIRVWGSLRTLMCHSVACKQQMVLRPDCPRSRRGLRQHPTVSQPASVSAWQRNKFLCTPESVQKLKGSLSNLQGPF